MYLDNPQRVHGGIYQRAKFGSNQHSNFDNMQILIFCELRLIMYIHPSERGF